MNITMNIECSPEEARRLMGLPDMAPIHDIYMEGMKQAVSEGVTPELVEKMLRNWSPVGEAGFAVWKQLVDQMTGTVKK